MLISKINCTQNLHQSKFTQNFKGLWGKSEYQEYYSTSADCYDTIMHYYPFKDESQKEIDEVVKRGTSSTSSCADSRYVPDPVPQYHGSSVVVHPALEFTKEQFEDFLSATNNPDNNLTNMVIERIILRNNLRK